MTTTDINVAKKIIVNNVIESVVGVIAQKSQINPKEIQFSGKVLDYTKDVGMLISVLITLHDIFGLTFNEDLNAVEAKFVTIEDMLNYFLDRIVKERLSK